MLHCLYGANVSLKEAYTVVIITFWKFYFNRPYFCWWTFNVEFNKIAHPYTNYMKLFNFNSDIECHYSNYHIFELCCESEPTHPRNLEMWHFKAWRQTLASLCNIPGVTSSFTCYITNLTVDDGVFLLQPFFPGSSYLTPPNSLEWWGWPYPVLPDVLHLAPPLRPTAKLHGQPGLVWRFYVWLGERRSSLSRSW